MGEKAMRQSFPVLAVYETGHRNRQIMKEKGFTVKDIQNYLGLSAPQSI